jgi:hydrogenase maturation protein HypF
VERLRTRKRRPHKPFALLVDDPARLAPLLNPTPAEQAALADAAAPIVLLPCRDDRHGALFPGVAPAAPALGVMLPASPLHLLLAQDFGGPLVATSGNRSGEPLCTEPAEALEVLGEIADAFLVHNRPIARPLDDSVLQLIDGHPALLRRARGYAPEPLPLARPVAGAVLALGGDLKSAPALALGDRLWLAPHLGDLADARVQERWRQGLQELLQRHGDVITAVVMDRHPGYGSHQQAAALLAEAGLTARIPLRAVGEHGLALPLAVLALDGLGYGTGKAPLWGGELLWLAETGTQRLASLRPFPLPGGERAMREPRRSALGLLHEAGLLEHPGARRLQAAFATDEWQGLLAALASNCNCPRTSSAGRLFDAVAAMLGLVTIASHEAQAGLAVQAAALRGGGMVLGEELGGYSLPYRAVGSSEVGESEPDVVIDWMPLVLALLEDISGGQPAERCAARFQNGLVVGLVATVVELVPDDADVALMGGCFQNRGLLEGLLSGLRERGRRSFWSERVPLNDGGLAVGQVMVIGSI